VSFAAPCTRETSSWSSFSELAISTMSSAYLRLFMSRPPIRFAINKHSSHQNAGFSIWVFQNFPGVIPPDPHSGRGRPPPAPNTGACTPVLGPKPRSPQLFSRGCAPEIRVAKSNGDVRIFTGSSEVAVSAHTQYKFRPKYIP